ncbi:MULTISPECIES: tetratricopeptide repeat protein [unclassified Mycobacterium]|uniref:tetratricopeptide repeat protein n=1 Tax=unclassified Mycobacterium TaxID=2642494 RepID=UPI0027423F4A|nr:MULTISPECIES: tetratricopeptide repeat protein [unclassified Mycobacterium]MDP7703369.1 tetratricopeptide repeat protein [Mycobacterium sp. TY815]MDP7721852.1 tetratricopeptide repeat protein [Mycobacterium sp. TY814]
MTQPGPDPVAEAIVVADAYIESKNYQRAREVLRQVLAEHPNDPGLLAHHARAEYLIGDHAQAASSAYAALSAAPHDELAMRIYALALDGQGRGQEALWMAWRTVTQHPNEVLSHRLYARILQKAHRHHDALIEVDEALRLAPADVDTLVLRGTILHDLGYIAESSAAYERALSLDPGNAEAQNNLAVNRLRGGKFGHALRGFLGAAGSDPTLGNLVRRNIGAVLATILRRVTVLALVVGILSAFVGSSHDRDFRTVLMQVLIVMSVVVLIGNFVWLLRAVPRRTLVSAARSRAGVVVRIVHAVLAAVVGTYAVAFGGPWAIPAGVFVAISGLFIVRFGLLV